jgi:hypothetical protein
MTRTRSLATVAALALAACQQPEVRVEPSRISALEGQRTVVRVSAQLGCDDPADPVLEAADGAGVPVAVSVHRVAKPDEGGDYFIGNPGLDRDIPGGGTSGEPYDPSTGRTVTVGREPSFVLPGRRFDLLVRPADGVGPGERRLRVRVDGCGTEAFGDLTLDVVGRVELGGFCGLTSGASCAEDAGCERAGAGEVCAAAGTREREELARRLTLAAEAVLSHASACTDPVPSGATCGCVSGACSWRLP